MYRLLLLLALLAAPAHADTRISQLPDGGPAQANDSVPATRAGGSIKIELGTAAGKAASGTGATVSSVAGATTAGHIATFFDANGTVQDGGAPQNYTLTAPTLSALGGIRAALAQPHQFLTGIDLTGTPTFGQPAATDVSGLAPVATSGNYLDLANKPVIPTLPTLAPVATSGSYPDLLNKPVLAPSATVDTTNAANISSGTLSGARLPAPTASILGGIKALAAVAHQFLTGVDTAGNPTFAQPAASDISGLAPVATSGSYNDLSNKPAGLAPSGAASGDLSGSFPGPTVAKINGLSPAASATTDTTNAANISSGTLAAARLPAFSGDVATTAGSAATTIAPGSVTATKLAPGAVASNVGTLGGDLSGTLTAPSVVRINGATPATVATSGSYLDLLNRPLLGTVASHPATDFLTPTSTLIATGTTAARALSDHFADTKRAQDFNVKCDGTQLVDITVTAGSAVIASASYQFSSADVGKSIEVTDELETTGISTTIAAVSGGNATLAANWTGGNIARTARATFYTTDDTAAINAGLAASITPDASGNNMLGFRFVLPGRVCVASTIVQPRMSHLEFEGGPQSGILHRKWGANAPLLKSENFDALTGTGLSAGNGTMTNTSQAVPYYYGFTAHLDCNKAGNTASNCVSYYGNARRIGTGTLVENSSGDGLYLEKTGDHACSATDWRMKEEDMIGDIMVRNNAGYAVRNRSNDSYVENLISYNNAGNWINETSPATVTSCDGVTSVPKFNGGMHFNHFHPYTATNGINGDFGSPTSLNYFYNDYGRAIIRDHFNVPYNQTTACGYLGLPCYDIQATASYDQIGQVDLSMKAGQSVSPAAFNIPSGTGPVITQILGSSVAPGANSTAVKVRNSFDRVSGGISNFSASGSIGADLGGSFNYFAFNGFGNATHFAYTPGHHNIGLFQCYTGGGAGGSCGTITPAATDDFTILSDDPATPSAHYVPALYLGGSGTAATPALGWSSDKTTGFYRSAAGKIDMASAGAQIAEFSASGLALTGMNTAGVVTNSASGILASSATLPASMLPAPSASTLGGVNSVAAVAHSFLTGISTSGAPSQAQPSCADLANAAPSCATDATNAANIASGTLPAARLPAPTATSLGGIQSAAAVANQFISAISTAGVPQFAQPSFSNLAGIATNAQIPAPTISALGGIQAASGATSNQFLTYVDTSGLPHAAQPGFANLAGSLAASQFPAVTGDIAIPAGSTAATLPAVNSNTGTFNNVTVNAKGQVTAAANTAYLTGNQTITVSGDVAGSGSTSIPATIQPNAVTYAKLQQESAATLLGNPAGASASPSEITLGGNLTLSGSTLNARQYFTWSVGTISGSLTNGSAVIVNGSGQLVETLPTTCTPGDHYKIAGFSVGGWKLAQNSGQNVQFGSISTTQGTAGSITSQNQYDGIEAVCVVANTTYLVVGAAGKPSVN